MVKRSHRIVIAIIIFLVGFAYNSAQDTSKKHSATDDKPEVKYSTKNDEVEFTFPSDDWKLDTENEVLDLYAESGNEDTGVILYDKQDFPEEGALQTVFLYRVAAIAELVNDLEALSELEEYEIEGNTYLTMVYTGEYKGFIQVYRFTGISFQDSDIIAFVIQYTQKSKYSNMEPVFKSITDSARVKSGGE